METKAKIGSGQLFAILILSRILYSMLYRTESFSSGTPLLLGQLIATAIEAVICIPALMFSAKGMSIFEACGKSKIVGTAYGVYFTWIFATTVCDFVRFIHSEFSQVATPIVAAITLGLACIYCACMGIEGLARGAGVLFVCVVLLVCSMTLLSDGSPNVLYLQPYAESDGKTMLDYILEDLSVNRMPVMLVALSGNLRKSGVKAGVGYLLFKLIFIEGLIYAVTVILWRYVNIPSYPIQALGAYAKTDLVRRFDSLNMFFWTLNCVLTGGTYLRCGSSGSEKRYTVAVGIVGTACGLAKFYGVFRLDESLCMWLNIAAMVILGTLVPLAALLYKRGNR